MPKSYKCKLMLLGRAGSGKTSFINGNLNNDWPIGISFNLIECFANENDIYRFLIWDLKDRPHFHFMFKDFCRGAYAGLICFDLSDRESFTQVKYWIDLIRKGAGNVPLILIGTKMDIENREIKDQEIVNLIEEENLETIFFHSIYGENDSKYELFKYLVQKLDPNYRLSNFSMIPRELEDEQFRIFIEKFSTCPVCNSELHYSALKKVFFSKDPNQINIKNQLINLLDKFTVNEFSQSLNINIGISCCKCYKKIFENE